MTRFRVLGRNSGPRRIEPACSLLDIDEPNFSARIVFDCGIEPIRRGFRAPSLKPLQDGKLIDAVLTTHGHVDHIAYLPALVPYLKPDAKIYGTPQTIQTLPYIIEDQFKFGVRYKRMPFNILEMFDVVTSRMQEIAKPGEFEIPPGIKVYAHPVGHIPGACGYIVVLPDGTKLMVTGDMSGHNQPTVTGYRPMPNERKPDVLAGTDLTGIMNEQNPDYNSEADKLAQDIFKFWEDGGSLVAIPAFANNKSQCGAAELNKRGILPYLEQGSALAIANVFAQNRWSENDQPFDLNCFKKIEGHKHRRELQNDNKPKVVISPSGLCQGGQIMNWLKVVLPNPKAMLAFIGYVPEDSNAGQIMKAKAEDQETVTLFDDKEGAFVLQLKCKVRKYNLTSHGDGDFTFRFIEEINPSVINLTHGIPAAKLFAASRLAKRGRKINCCLPKYFLDSIVRFRSELFIHPRQESGDKVLVQPDTVVVENAAKEIPDGMAEEISEEIVIE